MPRVIARALDGALLIAYGHAGTVIAGPDVPVDAFDLQIISVDSILARGYWEGVDEPVPDGLLTPTAVAKLREFEREQFDSLPFFMRDTFKEARPSTGDDPPWDD